MLTGWVLANMIPFWYLLKLVGLFRVPANEETVGLDASYHGGTAYPGHGADDFIDKSTSRHGKTMDEPMDGNGMNSNGKEQVLIPLSLPSHPIKYQRTPHLRGPGSSLGSMDSACLLRVNFLQQEALFR